MATAVAVKYWCPVCNEYTGSSVECDACGVAFDAEALKPSHNSAITPPEERDCDTCENDGDCYVTMLQCKGYVRAAQ